jgi:hypothetical protein
MAERNRPPSLIYRVDEKDAAACAVAVFRHPHPREPSGPWGGEEKVKAGACRVRLAADPSTLETFSTPPMGTGSLSLDME